MRVVFIGASRFGLRCFECLFDLPQCSVVGAITIPPTFSISYRPQGVTNVLHADIESAAGRHGVPCHVMQGVMNDPGLLQMAAAWRPQLFVVVGWYHLLPRIWRDMAPAIGLHASLLPDYSGGAPLVWAIINGEKRTGITLFQFDDGVDSGPIIGQAEEPILEEDTIATLYERIEVAGVRLLGLHVPRIAGGTASYRRQDESRRRVFRQRSPEDGRIDWRWSAHRVYDFVRAQTRPYPGAFTLLNGLVVKVWRSRLALAEDPDESREDPAGSYSLRSGGVHVACGDRTALRLEEIELNGATYRDAQLAQVVGARGAFQ
jgi:methionyl-tRNA formyltransferase